MVNVDYVAELRELNRQKLFRRVTQSVLRVHSLAHEAQRLKNALSVVVARMQQVHHLNRELMLVDARRKATYALIWLAAAACYLLDFVLLSAVAEYFARRVYSDLAMVTLARTVIPAAIIVIEMLVSSQRALAQERDAEYGKSKTPKVWVVFTGLLLIFVPAMLIATHLVTLPENLTPVWATVSLVQLLGLLALAAVAHGAVLYGGPIAVEAKAYLYLKFRWWRLSGRERRLNDRAHAATGAVTQAYLFYLSLGHELVGEFPNSRFAQARFDTTTQTLLLEAFGGQLPILEPGAPRYATTDGEVLEA